MGSPLGVRMPRRGTAKRQYQIGNDQYTYFLFHGKSLLDESVMGYGGAGEPLTSANMAYNVGASYPCGPSVAVFNGTSSYIMNSVFDPNMSMVNLDYTIQTWAMTNNIAATQMLMTAAYAGYLQYYEWQLQINVSGGLSFLHYYDTSGDAYFATSSTGLISNGVPFHVAACRNGATNRLYLNGVQVASVAVSAAMNNPGSSANLCLGVWAGTSWNYWFNGWLQEAKIDRGICRYPNGTSFTPPAIPSGPDAR